MEIVSVQSKADQVIWIKQVADEDFLIEVRRILPDGTLRTTMTQHVGFKKEALRRVRAWIE